MTARASLIFAALAALLSSAACTPPMAYTETEDEIRVTFGPGGQIGKKYETYQSFRNSGKTVVLDGHLISADAFFGFSLPNACYTNRAIFSPHAASYAGIIPSARYTEALTQFLPSPLADWFRSRAGYGDAIGFETVEYDTLVTLWPEGACDKDIGAALRDFHSRKARLAGYDVER